MDQSSSSFNHLFSTPACFRDVTGVTQEDKIVSIWLAEMSVVVKRFFDIRKNQEQLPNGI